MSGTTKDDAILARLSVCPTATLCDAYIKSGFGRPERLFMRGLRPLHSKSEIVAGRARTKELEIVLDAQRSTMVSDRRKALEQVDECGPGDFLVVAAPQGPHYAIWGGHLSLRALMRGAAGVVADGWARDVGEILALGLPTWCQGATPIPSGYGGYSVRYNNVPVTCAGVEVQPDDYLVADLDGVIVVPKAKAANLVTVCEEMKRDEEDAEVRLKSGNSLLDSYVSRSYYLQVDGNSEDQTRKERGT